MGRPVGPQTNPLSSSRTNNVSPGVSLTGSFDQGVSLFSRLFADQVYPEPDSETWNPNAGFATTLIQGAGVHCPLPRIVTYSRPSGVNPPRPFQNSSSSAGGDGASPLPRAGRRRCGTGSCLGACSRTTCSDSVPRLARIRT